MLLNYILIYEDKSIKTGMICWGTAKKIMDFIAKKFKCINV